MPTPTRRQLLLLGGGAAAGALLSGCSSGPSLADHRGQTPVFDLRRFFDGRVLAHGIVSERGGKIARRLYATLDCSWQGDRGTLDENFLFDDGERQRRVWRLQRLGENRYSGRADDVVGEALGESVGPAFNWHYTLQVPVRGSVYDIDFDDWMYLIDESTVLNRASMSKFGVQVGEVLISLRRA